MVTVWTFVILGVGAAVNLAIFLYVMKRGNEADTSTDAENEEMFHAIR